MAIAINIIVAGLVANAEDATVRANGA